MIDRSSGGKRRDGPDVKALRAGLEETKRQTRNSLDLINGALERSRKRSNPDRASAKVKEEKPKR